MSLNEKDRKWLKDAYNGLNCMRCDGSKSSGFFFCARCWYKLPTDIKDDVIVAYRAHGLTSTEFSKAFDNAVLWEA